MDLEFVLTNTKTDSIIRNGLIAATCLNQSLRLLDYGNVIVQENYRETSQVRIITGGANFMGDLVGKGMLTAAIQGEQSSAPASNIILRTLHELCHGHPGGALVIVPGDIGDMLNFGVAVERALNSDLRIRTMTVCDDRTCDRPRRCLCGIVLVYKIAGAMADGERNLAAICDYCRRLCENMVSAEIEVFGGQSYDECKCNRQSSPVDSSSKYLPQVKVCLDNLIKVCRVSGSTDALNVDCLDDEFSDDKLLLTSNDEIVVLVNNNNELEKLEMYSLVKDMIEYLRSMNLQVQRFYIGDFMQLSHTKLSFTILKVIDSDVLYYLDAACEATGWLRMVQGEYPLNTDVVIKGVIEKTIRTESPVKGPRLSETHTNILLFSMQFACNALISCERQLNCIDANKFNSGGIGKFKGDTGTRMRTLSELLLKRMKVDKIPLEYPFTFFDNMSKILEKSLGGSTGCIYSIMFEAAANVFGAYELNEPVRIGMWMEAFGAVVEALQRYCDVRFGDGTMFDPIYRFVETSKLELERNCSSLSDDGLGAFGVAVEKAEETIEEIKKRKVYADPGAHAVGIWMRAIYEGVKVRWPN
ncbi:unnamed protein product [Phyllotreta striolata]|uniref:Triokinase/FMN cyclase n=1 Tax=Phyllotreta striolata TaxID=444603 RepID=A0A9N9TMM0_PHYSR|nr:unnamed protein product [Phyllotreta striolata]